MGDPFARLRRFLRELKRRKVYRVAAGYLVVAFVVLQLANLAADAFGFPGWFEPMVWVVAGLGFPIVLVVAWAFEMTPEGMRRTPATSEAEEASESEAMAPEERQAQSRLAMKALVGLGLVGAAVAGGWYLMGGGGESPEETEGTVAVLPFQVSGSASEQWRDGMVSLLTTGLDGAAGLRAIADRTVFATWEQSGPGDAGATTEQALSVAHQTGARYAVVGTAAGVGSNLQLSAAAYETTSGERLGQVEVRGSPDSVTALADSLTRRVLGVLLDESGEELSSVNLANLTTSSLPALKAYLRGERHFRAGEYELAIEDYEAAIEQDSSFALAYPRLALSRGWAGEAPARGKLLRRAYELSSDRLPRRERRIVRARYIRNVQGEPLAAADTFRRLTEAYPDDPSTWYELGETIIHGNIPGGWPEAERALEEAVQLDPAVAPYHHHLVDAALSLHHDSALAARRIEAHPGGELKHWYQAFWDLNFGSGDRRWDAWARVDTLPIGADWWVYWPLKHPTDLALRDSLLRRVIEREDVRPPRFTLQLVVDRLFQGRIDRALADLRTRDLGEGFTACILAYALTLGHAVPDSTAAQHLAPEHLPDGLSLDRFHCAGLYLVESDRGDELDNLIRRLRATVDTTRQTGVSPGRRQAVVRELRGYRAWKQGELERAAQLWNRSNESLAFGALWRGNLYRELGQLETAEGWYLAAWRHPVAHERLGQIYEEMARPEDAAAAYRRFITAWEDADSELQDRVEAARKRLQELKGSVPESDE